MPKARSAIHNLPPEIRVEAISASDAFMPAIQNIVQRHGVPAGQPEVWLKNLRKHLASGEANVVSARYGRTLVGFLVLEPEAELAPFSWVAPYYKHCGLGQRFYSFACIHLARPAPEFYFHQDLMDEYAPVIKRIGAEPEFRDPYYVLHARPHAPEDAPQAA